MRTGYVTNIFDPQAGKNLCDRKIAPSKHRLRNNVKRDSNDIVTAANVKIWTEFVAPGIVGSQAAILNVSSC